MSLLAGCGSSSDDTSTADAGFEAKLTDLLVTLDPDGQGPRKPREASLTCEPGSQAGDDCALINDLPAHIANPIPPQRACPELFGGRDTVEIHGTLRGEVFEAELTRVNGCEVDRFDEVLPILQELFPKYEPGSALGGA